MCNKECCALKTALQIRMMKRLAAKQLAEDLAKPPELIIPTPHTLHYTYEDVQAAADFIIEKTQIKPKFGLVCSSNLDMLVDLIENPIILNYADIPKFPEGVIHGQRDKMYIGTILGTTIIAMQGRYNVYEGYALAGCSMPLRIMKFCGIEYLFLTCSSGAINPGYEIGDIILVKDHINLVGILGNSPLIGPHDDRFGKRIFSMVNAYDSQLIEKALEIGNEIGYGKHMRTGIYACLGGPPYESLAERKMLKVIGADMVGTSLVHEVVIARQAGLKVCAFSLIVMSPEEGGTQNPSKYGGDQDEEIFPQLISRMIYKIENDLMDTPGFINKLDANYET